LRALALAFSSKRPSGLLNWQINQGMDQVVERLNMTDSDAAKNVILISKI